MSTTPILDLEQDYPVAQPRSRRAFWRRVCIIMAVEVVVGCCVVVADSFGWLEGLDDVSVPSCNWILLLPALVAAILIHELGHAAAAKLAGMRLGGIGAVGLILLRSGRNWVCRFAPQFLLNGRTISLSSHATFGRASHALMIAGGPLASLLMAAICWVAVGFVGDGAWEWIGTLFWCNAFTVFVTVIPFSKGGVISDGRLLLMLARESARARGWMGVMSVQAEDLLGVRPRDWDEHMMARALETPSTEPYYAAAQMFGALRATDRGHRERALQHLENALGSKSRVGNKSVSLWCFLEAAIASAEDRNNPQQARVWLERATKLIGVPLPEMTLGAEGRIAIAEGRYEEALGLLARQREMIEKQRLDNGGMRLAKDRIGDAERRCRAVLAGDTASA